MNIETTRKENDWEHKFYVTQGWVDPEDIEVIMSDTDRGQISAKWKEDGWTISAEHWYGDGDRLPGRICFRAEKMIPTKDEDGFEDHDWLQVDIEVELWGSWESDRGSARVDVHAYDGCCEEDVPTNVAIGVAADIREACYRIYSEKRECVIQ